MAKRKRFDKEFRLGAARLVVEQGYTKAEAARRLGVTATSISKWIERFLHVGAAGASGPDRARSGGDEVAPQRSQAAAPGE